MKGYKYGSLRVPPKAPPQIKALVYLYIDPRFEEFEFFLGQQMPRAGPKGTLQIPLAILVCALCDASAQLLIPGKLSNRKLFEKFLLDFYPWDKDEPDGMTHEEACEEMWERFRNPLTHRFGLGGPKKKPGKPDLRTKVGRSFAANLPYLNAGDRDRPLSKTFLVKDKERTILWIDAFYWGLRRAVEKAVYDPARWPEIEAHIKGGHFIR